MVMGTLSSMQKGQTSGFSGCSHIVDTVHSGHSGCSMHGYSRIVVYGGGKIVFDTEVKPEDAVNAVQCRIVVYGGGDIVLFAKRSNHRMQWTQYAVE